MPRKPVKLLARRKADQNRAVVDPWTAVHFSAGLALGLVRAPLGWSLSIALGYEVVEQFVERRRWGQDLLETAGPETVPNALTDLLVFAAGHALAEAWNATEE